MIRIKSALLPLTSAFIMGSGTISAAIVNPQVDYNSGSNLFFTDSSNAIYSNTGEAFLFYGTFSTVPTTSSTSIEVESFFNQLGTSTDVYETGHSFTSGVEETLFENQRGYLMVTNNSVISQSTEIAIVSNSTDADWTFASDLSLPILPTPDITPDQVTSTFPGSELILGNRDTFGANETIKLQAITVPEPSSTALLGLGMTALLLRRRK